MTEDKEIELLNADIKQLMNTPFGRRVIWEILGLCEIYTDNSYEVNAPIEGKRAVGLNILSMLDNADSKIYANLILTNQSKENDA